MVVTHQWSEGSKKLRMQVSQHSGGEKHPRQPVRPLAFLLQRVAVASPEIAEHGCCSTVRSPRKEISHGKSWFTTAASVERRRNSRSESAAPAGSGRCRDRRS